MSDLVDVAHYQRRIRASEERVWENVRDWEHLPWLHASSFRAITLEDSGDWGWRARIGLHGGDEIRLELVIDGDRYVSRTLDGGGAGSEIWTQVLPHGQETTDIEVEFHLPGIEPQAVAATGAGFVRLYTQLWDEDERMMRERTRRLGEHRSAASFSLDVGPIDAVERELPMRVEFGGRAYRIISFEGELHIHAAVCPHWLGPLENAPNAAGELTCSWHGYRFDLRTGRRCGGSRPIRLPKAPRLEIAEGRVTLRAN